MNEDYCRICLNNAGEVPLNIKSELNSDGETATVYEMILTCFNFEIFNHELAYQSVCQDCYDNVVNSYNFKRILLESDQKIRQSLEDAEMKVEFLVDNEEDIRSNCEEGSEFTEETIVETRIPKEHLEIQKCFICDLEFQTKSRKLQHFKNHHPDSPGERPQCKLCKHVAKNFVTLNIHLKNHNCSFTCSNCRKKYATEKLLELHLTECEPKSFVEIQCEKDLRTHLKINEECKTTRNRQIKCYLCEDLHFKFSYQKKQHLEEFHANEKDLSCKICNSTSKTVKSLDRHIMGHFEELPDFMCELCGIIFRQKELLKKHVKLHHVDRPHYTCDLCGVSLSLKQSVQRHMKAVHMRVFNYSCSICGPGYSYSNLTSYNSHLFKNHGKIPPISCPDCGLGFTFNYELKNHKGKTGTCGKSKEYVRVLDENNKIKWRAQKTWEFGYFSDKKGEIFCKLCHNKYTTTDNLMIHYKVQHQGFRFQCDECECHYSSRKGLRTHKIARHLNLRPYACNICSKDFNEKRNLDRHMLTHSGRRDFNCPACEKAFQEKGGVRRHLKTVHKHMIQVNPASGTIRIKMSSGEFAEV